MGLNPRPPLVIVSGPPASGKTTLAVPLACGLGLPLLAKDTIKEAVMDALGCDSVDRSRELGKAAFEVLFALAETQLEVGTGAVVEANFHPDASVAGLSRLVARSRAAGVFCWAPPDALIQRYRRRRTREGGTLVTTTWTGSQVAQHCSIPLAMTWRGSACRLYASIPAASMSLTPYLTGRESSSAVEREVEAQLWQ